MNPSRIKHYESLGWTFRHEEWQNGHNGDWEDSYYLKSPRLKEECGVNERYNHVTNQMEEPWVWMTEKQILAAEREAYVNQRIGDGTWGSNHRAVIDTVRKVLLKDPDAKRVTVTIRLS